VAFYSDFAEHYESVFPFEEHVYAFLESLLPAGARRVLDIGCGTGHYCGRFAADGLTAVGIDLDPEMIEVARRNYPESEFRAMDMLDVGEIPGSFDLVFCIGNVAAHVRQECLPRFLGDVGNLLASPGAWALQTVNWDYVLERETFAFPDTRVVPAVIEPARVEPGVVRPAAGESAVGGRALPEVVFSRRYEDISERKLRFLTRLAEGGRTVFEGDVWLYPVRSDEYLRLHEDAGFSLVGRFASFERREFDPGRHSSSVFAFRSERAGRRPSGEVS